MSRSTRTVLQSDAPPAVERRRTLSGDADAEARVAQDLALLAAAIDGELGPELAALILIGTHARADASVAVVHEELTTVSSYELLAVLRTHSRKLSSALERLASAWSERLETRVCLHGYTLKDILSARPSLSWVEIAAGKYEVLTGPSSALAALYPVHPKDLPADAAARLLRDAALGLAFSNLDALGRQEHGPRRLYHAALLCGDSQLLQASHFVLDLRQRAVALGRLARTPEATQLAEVYEEAIAYQQRPDLHAPADYARLRDRLRPCLVHVHLQLEADRLGTPTEPLGYALFGGRLWPTTKLLRAHSLRTTLRAARRGDPPRDASAADPQERLARCAVLLGYAHDRPEARRLAADLLGLPRTGARAPDDLELLVRLHMLAERVSRDGSDPLAMARYGRG